MDVKALNEKLEGFRGFLVVLGSWILLLLDTFTANITGLSANELKGAFLFALPITVKLILIDVRRKLFP